jgi:type IV pilus assembly protein PilE
MQERGLSLIELMVVVAVLAVIAGIGYPLYTDQVQKSRRYDAQAALVVLANKIEQLRALNPNSGYDVILGSDPGSKAAWEALLSEFADPAKRSVAEWYDFPDPVPAATASSFVLKARPKSGSAQEGDRCLVLTLDEQGEKGVEALDGSSSSVTNCWQ